MEQASFTCGVLVTDGVAVLLGHATRSPRWDIPKGMAEAGETHAVAAARELREETGIEVAPELLQPLGVFAYMRAKRLALFLWRPPALPDPAGLVCTSMVRLPDGGSFPEMDRFGLFPWTALPRLGRDLARVLAGIDPAVLRGVNP